MKPLPIVFVGEIMKTNASAVTLALLLLAGCSGGGDTAPDTAAGDDISTHDPGAELAPPAAGTRPAGEPENVITVEGRIGEGVECPVIETPDGYTYALSLGEADFGPGDYVQINGELADASFCMQGEGTIIPIRIDAIEPPARDRDPARAGGVRITSDYVRGSWVAQGGDCARPDFDITANANGGNIIETSVRGVPTTGYVDVGDTPAFRFDQGVPDFELEARGPDGLAVLTPDSGAVELGGQTIEGDGVVFIKCAD